MGTRQYVTPVGVCGIHRRKGQCKVAMTQKRMMRLESEGASSPVFHVFSEERGSENGIVGSGSLVECCLGREATQDSGEIWGESLPEDGFYMQAALAY